MTDNIIVNEQSSIKIDDIYFDPYRVKNESHDAKIVFFTHSHYDHFSKDDYLKISNNDTLFVMPYSMKEEVLNNGIMDDKMFLLHPNETKNIFDISIETVPSYNTNKPMHKKEYGWLGYIIKYNNMVYYICGDTDYLVENVNIKCDIMFVPIGGTYTMNYKEAADYVNEIKPKIVIPIHYGTIVGTKEDFNNFQKLVNKDILVIEKLEV